MKPVDGAAIWQLKATHGLPLDFALANLADHEEVPTWDALVAAARKDGTNMKRFGRDLRAAIRDAYPPDTANAICARMPTVFPEFPTESV